MRDQMLCVLLAAIAYGTSAGPCEGAQASLSTVTFQSATYNDMRQLMAREAPSGAVTVKATLGFPERARDRYPAVIVVHSSAAFATATRAMSRPNCARQASPP